MDNLDCEPSCIDDMDPPPAASAVQVVAAADAAVADRGGTHSCYFEQKAKLVLKMWSRELIFE